MQGSNFFIREIDSDHPDLPKRGTLLPDAQMLPESGIPDKLNPRWYKWEWPTSADARVPINLIPNVAIQKKYWSEPKNDPPKYSTQILNHLVFHARKQTDRHGLLGLFVDPRNQRAISAYKKVGFDEYFRKYMEDGIEYQSMLLSLAAYQLNREIG